MTIKVYIKEDADTDNPVRASTVIDGVKLCKGVVVVERGESFYRCEKCGGRAGQSMLSELHALRALEEGFGG